jgi:pimeloyl-ACP methyl ester carboxylesterase
MLLTIATRILRFLRSWCAHIFFSLLAIPLFLLSIIRLVLKRGPSVLFRGWAERDGATIHARELEFGAKRFVELKNGIRLSILEAGDPKLPLLLLLPGFPECAFAWRWWLRAFSKSFHVVAVDQRGYNESSKPIGSIHYRVRELVEDVEYLIIALGHGGEKINLAAHDWGGMVGWCAAAQLDIKKTLASLIIINAPHPASYFSNLGIKQMLKSLYIVFFQLPYAPEWLLSRNDGEAIGTMLMGKVMGVRRRDSKTSLTNADLEVFKFAFSRPGAATGALNWYRQLFDATHDDFDALAPSREKPLSVPVLIIWGADDGALGPELIKGVEVYAPQVTTRLIQNCSHWAQQDAVEEVIDTAAAFLNMPPDKRGFA